MRQLKHYKKKIRFKVNVIIAGRKYLHAAHYYIIHYHLCKTPCIRLSNFSTTAAAILLFILLVFFFSSKKKCLLFFVTREAKSDNNKVVLNRLNIFHVTAKNGENK